MRLLSRPLLVRQEVVPVEGLARPVRLLYASDLHAGLPWTRGVPHELAEIAAHHQPDAVLLGGDLVETTSGIADLRDALRTMTQTSPVYAVEGNHDRRVGVARLREAVESAGAGWLGSAAVGPIQLEAEPLECARPRGARLVGAVRVLVSHDPAVFDRAAAAHFDLVLAGHLHGGQCVIFSRGDRLYPGAWLARYTGLRFARGRTRMIVSRGAADTLPLRWNCPREVILCTLS